MPRLKPSDFAFRSNDGLQGYTSSWSLVGRSEGPGDGIRRHRTTLDRRTGRSDETPSAVRADGVPVSHGRPRGDPNPSASAKRPTLSSQSVKRGALPHLLLQGCSVESVSYRAKHQSVDLLRVYVGSEIWAEAHGQAGAGGPVPCPEPYEIDVVIGSAGDICLRKAAPGYLRPRRLRPTHASPESTTPRFKALFVEPVGRISPHKRPLSRGMATHLSAIKEFDIAEDAAIMTTNSKVLFVLYCILFLVPKRSKPWEGRLVIDAPPVNRAQQRPGDMDIPSMRQVISRILSCSTAASATENRTSINPR
jgi:hypothetical protein